MEQARKYENDPNISFTSSCIENYFVNEVTPPVKDGVTALGKMVKTLDSIGMDAGTKEVKAAEPLLRKQATKAYKSMKKAYEEASKSNRLLDDNIQRKVDEQNRVKGELSVQKAELSSLNSKLQSLEEEQRQREDERLVAQRSVDSANESVSEAERVLQDKKDEQQIVRGVGAGLFVIPVFGWIAGGTMLAVSFTALENNIKAARKSVGKKTLPFDCLAWH